MQSQPLSSNGTRAVDGNFALAADSVSKSFGSTQAVSEVSLRIRPGEVWGLVGPNGAGKTTLLRCVCGLLRMDRGRASIFGHDVVADHAEAVRRLGFVPELPHPFPTLTPFEHLIFVARAFGLQPGWEAAANRLLGDLDLADNKNSLCGELSKGQRQKVHLAMVMLRTPLLLIMDEPLIGLDPKAAFFLKNWIRQCASAGGSALVSSHTLPFVEELCQRVAVLNAGRVVAAGTIDELRAASRSAVGTPFEQVFLKITGS